MPSCRLGQARDSCIETGMIALPGRASATSLPLYVISKLLSYHLQERAFPRLVQNRTQDRSCFLLLGCLRRRIWNTRYTAQLISMIMNTKLKRNIHECWSSHACCLFCGLDVDQIWLVVRRCSDFDRLLHRFYFCYITVDHVDGRAPKADGQGVNGRSCKIQSAGI